MKKILLNLYGAPCSGKSVKMMQLAVIAKCRGLFCEICPEVAKEYVVQQIPITRPIQLALSAEQTRRLKCFAGNVDVLITDAPVLIGSFYARYRRAADLPEIDAAFHQWSTEIAGAVHTVVNLYLWRDHPYDSTGRLESENEDEKIAADMWAYVQDRCAGEILLQAKSSELPETLWQRIMVAADI